MRASVAAHTRWSREPNRLAATAAGRKAFLDRFAREVDPDQTLDPKVRAKLAENAKAAYFGRLALASAKARRRKAAGS